MWQSYFAYTFCKIHLRCFFVNLIFLQFTHFFGQIVCSQNLLVYVNCIFPCSLITLAVSKTYLKDGITKWDFLPILPLWLIYFGPYFILETWPH